MTTNPTEIQAFYQQNLPRYLDLLRQMVEINSYTANPAGVNHLGDLVAGMFSPLGFKAETIQSAHSHFGKHLFLERAPQRVDQNALTIALISHLDTVYSPQEEAVNDFTWRAVEERIYGPGTVDIKGGTLLIYMLMEGLQQLAPEIYARTRWLAGLNASEERLSNEFSDRMIERLPASTSACLVFEGGTISEKGFPIVVARKGLARFRVQASGRSAHSGNAHPQGANAILQLSHTVQEIEAFTDYSQDLTFNVGVIQGGSEVNRVPHLAEAQVELRAFDPDVYQDAIERMYALEGSSKISSQDGYPCRVTVETLGRLAPWPHNPGSHKLFAVWELVGESLGLRAIPEQRGGLSDGNNLWSHFPTIDGLGPSGGNAHCSERSPDGNKDQEYVLVNSIVPKALLNYLGVLELLSRS